MAKQWEGGGGASRQHGSPPPAYAPEMIHHVALLINWSRCNQILELGLAARKILGKILKNDPQSSLPFEGIL